MPVEEVPDNRSHHGPSSGAIEALMVTAIIVRHRSRIWLVSYCLIFTGRKRLGVWNMTRAGEMRTSIPSTRVPNAAWASRSRLIWGSICRAIPLRSSSIFPNYSPFTATSINRLQLSNLAVSWCLIFDQWGDLRTHIGFGNYFSISGMSRVFCVWMNQFCRKIFFMMKIMKKIDVWREALDPM